MNDPGRGTGARSALLSSFGRHKWRPDKARRQTGREGQRLNDVSQAGRATPLVCVNRFIKQERFGRALRAACSGRRRRSSAGR